MHLFATSALGAAVAGACGKPIPAKMASMAIVFLRISFTSVIQAVNFSHGRRHLVPARGIQQHAPHEKLAGLHENFKRDRM